MNAIKRIVLAPRIARLRADLDAAKRAYLEAKRRHDTRAQRREWKRVHALRHELMRAEVW